MNKQSIGMLALVLLAIPFSAAQADKDSDKIVFATTFPGQEARDCKISIKEIREEDGTLPGKKYICGADEALGNELHSEAVPSDLARVVSLAADGKVALSISYTGTDEKQLAATFAAWENYLETKRNLIVDADWNLTLVSQEASTVVYRYDNAKSGESFSFSIAMGYKIPKDKKDKKAKKEDASNE